MPADPQVASTSHQPEGNPAVDEHIIAAKAAVVNAHRTASLDYGRLRDMVLEEQHNIVCRLERIAAAIQRDPPTLPLHEMMSHFNIGLEALQASSQIQRFLALEEAESIFSLGHKHKPPEVKATKSKHGRKDRRDVESSAKASTTKAKITNHVDDSADTPIAVNRTKRKAAIASTSSTPVVEKPLPPKPTSTRKENGSVKKRTSNRLSKTPRVPAREEDEQTYCFCSRVSFGEMIGCDNEKCEIEWFHFECIGLTTKPKGRWFCPNCRHPDTAKMPKTGKGKKEKD